MIHSNNCCHNETKLKLVSLSFVCISLSAEHSAPTQFCLYKGHLLYIHFINLNSIICQEVDSFLDTFVLDLKVSIGLGLHLFVLNHTSVIWMAVPLSPLQFQLSLFLVSIIYSINRNVVIQCSHLALLWQIDVIILPLIILIHWVRIFIYCKIVLIDITYGLGLLFFGFQWFFNSLFYFTDFVMEQKW